MFINISPADSNLVETLSTLNFGQVRISLEFLLLLINNPIYSTMFFTLLLSLVLQGIAKIEMGPVKRNMEAKANPPKTPTSEA